MKVQAFFKSLILTVSCATLVFVQIEDAKAQSIDPSAILGNQTALALGLVNQAGQFISNVGGQVRPYVGLLTTGALAAGGTACAVAGSFTAGLGCIVPVAISYAVMGTGLFGLYSVFTSPTTGKSTAVVVSGSTVDKIPNPGISTTPSTAVTLTSPALFALKNSSAIPYLNFNFSECTTGSSYGTQYCRGQGYPATASATWTAFSLKLVAYFKQNFGVDIQSASDSISIGSVSWCPTSTGVIGCVQVFGKAGAPTVPSVLSSSLIYSQNSYLGSTYWSATFPVMNGTPISCNPFNAHYDYKVNACVLNAAATPTQASDSTCFVNFNSAGIPLYNETDPDCIDAISTGSLAADSGGGSTPPTITLLDANSGTKEVMYRPNAQSQLANVPSASPQIGLPVIASYLPNTTLGTTEKRIIDTPAPTLQQPAPGVIGQNSQYLPGVGADVKETPLSSVAVSNWPSVMNVQGTVTCSNCTAANAQAPVVNVAAPNVTVNTPDRIKIDNEGHTPNLSAPSLPGSAPEFGTSEFSTKASAWKVFHAPPHSSSCSLNIDFDVPGMSHFSSTGICDFIEGSTAKPLIQAIAQCLVLLGCARILLGA